MNLLPLYHRLPAFGRNWAASLHGYRLRNWRYGPETERLVQESLEREHWPVERLRDWSRERLARLLWKAERDVPYYREQWSKRRQAGDSASPEYLENWPILEKEQVRLNPRAFLVDGCDLSRMHAEETSGTTGTPLRVWQSRETTRTWYALAEARWRRWYGVSLADRWAMFGGKMIVPAQQRRPPFWVWNHALNQLYVSSYHLAPESIPPILDALEKHRVTYLAGYSASLNAVAQEALRLGRRLPDIKVVIAEAEAVYGFQRASIGAAFDCPVRQGYGMCEKVGAASEGDCGQLHLWPEAGWTEVCGGADPLPTGQTGDLVFTGLLNVDMPLIRYRVGDRGSLAPPGACSCSRTLPRMASLEGRIADVLRTADGRTLSPNAVDIVFTADLAIKEAQIVQRDLRTILMRIVPATGFDPAMERRLAASLRERLGPVAVSFEYLSRIPRGQSGKFKAVASEIAASD